MGSLADVEKNQVGHQLESQYPAGSVQNLSADN
jgi:hypothetical protein